MSTPLVSNTQVKQGANEQERPQNQKGQKQQMIPIESRFHHNTN